MNAETDERRTEGTKRRMSVQISIYWIGGALVLWGGTQVAAQEEGVSPIPLPAPSNQETGPAPIGYDALRQELAGQDFLLEGMRARLFAQDAVAIVVPRDPFGPTPPYRPLPELPENPNQHQFRPIPLEQLLQPKPKPAEGQIVLEAIDVYIHLLTRDYKDREEYDQLIKRFRELEGQLTAKGREDLGKLIELLEKIMGAEKTGDQKTLDQLRQQFQKALEEISGVGDHPDPGYIPLPNGDVIV